MSGIGAPYEGAYRVPVLRWGLWDVVIVWFVGLGSAVVGQVVAVGVSGTSLEDSVDDPLHLAFSGAAQFVGMLTAMWLISRVKGQDSLAADFGLSVDWRRDWWFLPVGTGLQIVVAILLAPLTLVDGDREQEVVEALKDSSGPALALFVVVALVFAPIVEELLFRGLLLRALLRRVSPTAAVAWSSLAFGLVHLIDPNAIIVLPALVALGMVAAIVTIRSGAVGRAILLHIGFNAFTAVSVVVT